MVPQTSEELVNLGRPLSSRFVAAGIMIITAIRASMLKVEPANMSTMPTVLTTHLNHLPTEFIRAIHFVEEDEIQQWRHIRSAVSKKVCQYVGT